MPSSGIGPVPISPFFGLEEDVHSRRNVTCDQRGNADAEVGKHARAQLLSNAPGDDDLCVHGRHSWAMT